MACRSRAALYPGVKETTMSVFDVNSSVDGYSWLVLGLLVNVRRAFTSHPHTSFILPHALLLAQAAPLFHELLVRAHRLVAACPCRLEKGCPSCVQHTACKNYNAVSTSCCILHCQDMLAVPLVHRGTHLTQS